MKANQINQVVCCTKALFFSPPTAPLRRHWLDEKRARKHLNPYGTCLYCALTPKSLSHFDFHQNPHRISTPEPTARPWDKTLCGSRKYLSRVRCSGPSWGCQWMKVWKWYDTEWFYSMETESSPTSLLSTLWEMIHWKRHMEGMCPRQCAESA